MATIYDVATAAGVSPKTVSRVINGSTLVRESTRLAVTAAIERLGYVPSSAARAMRSNRSRLVGLVTHALAGAYERPDLAGLPDLVLVQAIQQRLEDTGLTLLMADSGGKPERARLLLRTFAEHRVEGVFYVAPCHQEIKLPQIAGIAHTVIVNAFDRVGTPAVVPDDYTWQRALVDRLIVAGHRRIAYLTLPVSLIATELRTLAWRDAQRTAGIEPAHELLRVGDPSADSTESEAEVQTRAIEHYLSLPDPPTVICTGNDRMAMRVYGLLRARGLRVPDDMSVAGYDDHRLISETLVPALTTVELPYRRMGTAAVDLLTAAIDGQTVRDADPLRIAGSLQWRDSVANRPT